ncbi:MAG: VOC family protein [Solirubrobacterales bacterium]|nr:VOC family protein [Solirubrobacterales bacterium]
MGKRNGYQPGTFCWSELSTTDQDAAKAFYSGLFGWEVSDRPVGDGEVYSMMLLDGLQVAAIASQPRQQREAGVPALWNSYVAVEDADALTERAKGLGANVHAPPFDVLKAGRMAVLQDPQGAFLMLWQPHEHKGAQLVNAPSALVWNELQSPDLDASAAFYTDLFGWDVHDAPETQEGYKLIKNGDAQNGGMRELTPGSPPNWLVYFAVEDIDAGLARVEELGGSALMGPIDIDIARIAVVQDPQGAVFALYAGQLDP